MHGVIVEVKIDPKREEQARGMPREVATANGLAGFRAAPGT